MPERDKVEGKVSDLRGEIPFLEAKEFSPEPVGDSVIFAALQGKPVTPEVRAEPSIHIQPTKAAFFWDLCLWTRDT